MDQVKFIARAILCKDCVKEIKSTCKAQLISIINERKHHTKCNHCERLYKLERELDGV
jgi:hypothetical protein